MQRLDSIISTLLFGLISGVVILAPWMFGAWETWWFWPFMVCLFTAGACYAVRLMLSSVLGTRRLNFSTLTYRMIVLWSPFLVYALIRAIQADVRMDAERSFLLQSSPFLLGLMVATGLSEGRQRLLLTLIMVNFACLGVYGIANHYLTGNALVLWVPGFEQYQLKYHRATGTYFCPDHFSGLMEIAMGMGLALLLVRSSSPRQRIAALGVSAIAILAIFLTRSRGGGIVVGVVMMAALWLCTLSWNPTTRRLARGIGAASLIAGFLVITVFGGHYVERFKEYPWTKLEHSDRFQMSAAALRAWKTAPWFGVGPGMHQNVWPHFSASTDGDRSAYRWPTFPNNNYHSFEAHNDWVQLLEEYGLIGIALFLVATGHAVIHLFRRWKRWANLPSLPSSGSASPDWVLPGTLLAALAMAIHSVGDFNLQIPATVWVLGGLVGLATGMARHTPPHIRQPGSHLPP